MAHPVTTKLERLLDSFKESGEQYDPNDDVDRCLVYSDMRQLCLAYLRRRFIDMGIIARLDEFCTTQEEKAGHDLSFMKLRASVEEKKDYLVPDVLKLEVMQMAADFVDRFFPPRNGHALHNSSSSSSLSELNNSDSRSS